MRKGRRYPAPPSLSRLCARCNWLHWLFRCAVKPRIDHAEICLRTEWRRQIEILEFSAAIGCCPSCPAAHPALGAFGAVPELIRYRLVLHFLGESTRAW